MKRFVSKGRARDAISVRKPDFFIVGAPKCGTTAMTHYLSGHPEIFMARKEMHHFGSDLRFASHFYRRDLAAYLDEFQGNKDRRHAGDASVWYLFSTRAAAEIKAFNPDARIIIMLREPLEMLHSLYYAFRFDCNEQLPTFEEALAAEEDRRAGRRIPRRAYLAQALCYRKVVAFTDQVRRYLDVFGRERVHIVFYDDFAANTATAYRGVLDFLGVEPAGLDPDLAVHNANKSARSSSLRALLRAPLLRSALLRVRPWLPRPIFGLFQRAETRLQQMNVRVEARPDLSLELRDRMVREIAPEISRLSTLLGRDLKHWCKVKGSVTRRFVYQLSGDGSRLASEAQ